MGVPGLRGVAFRPPIVAQESAVRQGTLEHVLADFMGIVEEFCLLGRVCDDL
jgi:hypothetical protein